MTSLSSSVRDGLSARQPGPARPIPVAGTARLTVRSSAARAGGRRRRRRGRVRGTGRGVGGCRRSSAWAASTATTHSELLRREVASRRGCEPDHEHSAGRRARGGPCRLPGSVRPAAIRRDGEMAQAFTERVQRYARERDGFRLATARNDDRQMIAVALAVLARPGRLVARQGSQRYPSVTRQPAQLAYWVMSRPL